MLTDERRERRRAKEARKRARRRARKLGLSKPVFEGVNVKGGRPRVTDEQRRETQLRARRREADRRWYRRNRDKILAYTKGSPAYRAAHPRPTRGRPPLDAGTRLYRECLAEINRAAALFAKPSPEEKRQWTLERYRQNRARWKAANHEKALDVDRVSRQRRKERNPAQWAAEVRRRKERLRAAGKIAEYSRRYAEKHPERVGEHSRRVTAAARYLRSIGLLEWWGPMETTEVRRAAAYAYVKELGLL